ncbi:MAG: hypothetical protein ACJ8FS_08980 [Sphingomicrobium sp.]
MTGFIALGTIAALIGLVIVVTAVRHQSEQQPRYKAMLIGGVMLAAFGIVIAGFAIAYQRATPLAFNSATPTP